MLADSVETALDSLGERVTADHQMFVVGLRVLAEHLDCLAGLGAFDDKAWREFRLLLVQFMKAVTTERGDSDAIQSLLDRLAGVRDAEDSQP